jgi:hypothetical protein
VAVEVVDAVRVVTIAAMIGVTIAAPTSHAISRLSRAGISRAAAVRVMASGRRTVVEIVGQIVVTSVGRNAAPRSHPVAGEFPGSRTTRSRSSAPRIRSRRVSASL